MTKHEPPSAPSSSSLSSLSSSSAPAREARRARRTAKLPESLLPVYRRRDGRTCLPCRESRIRCSKTFPCAYCFRHNLKCTPLQGRGGRQQAEQQQQQGQEQEQSVAQGYEMDPLLELVLERHDPSGVAGLLIDAFSHALNEGVLDRGRVVNMMRCWTWQSMVAGRDTTWGALEAVSKMLNISPCELERRQALALEAPPAVRMELVQREAGVAAAKMERLRASDFWRLADDGVIPLFMAGVDGAEGHVYMCSNEPFRHISQVLTQNFSNTLPQYKTIGLLLQAAQISPDDRAAFLRDCVALHIARDDKCRPRTLFAKAVNTDGEIRVLMLQFRRVDTDSGHLLVVRAEPAPSNCKYITRLAHDDRRRHRDPSTAPPRHNPPLPLGNGGGGGSQGGGGGGWLRPAAFPAFACLPLPTPPTLGASSASLEPQSEAAVQSLFFPGVEAEAKWPSSPSAPFHASPLPPPVAVGEGKTETPPLQQQEEEEDQSGWQAAVAAPSPLSALEEVWQQQQQQQQQQQPPAMMPLVGGGPAVGDGLAADPGPVPVVSEDELLAMFAKDDDEEGGDVGVYIAGAAADRRQHVTSSWM